MRTSHRRLLRVFHDPGCDFSKVRVRYIDRGADGDASWVDGRAIVRLDAEYFEVQAERGTKPIPYHRILEIQYDGNAIWERGRRDEDKGAPVQSEVLEQEPGSREKDYK